MQPQERIARNRQESIALAESAFRTVFTVASGTLALSITFRSSIAPADAVYLWLLKISWIGLTASVFGYIWFLMNLAIRRLDAILEPEKTGPSIEYMLSSTVFFGGFTVGGGFFLVFALLNT